MILSEVSRLLPTMTQAHCVSTLGIPSPISVKEPLVDQTLSS